MQIKDINKRFTEIVKEYLDKGFVLNAQTMGSCQSGVEASVDLTDGKSIYRVYIGSDTMNDRDGNYWGIHYKEICVVRFNKPPYKKSWGMFNSDGEELHNERYYEVERYHDIHFSRDGQRQRVTYWYVPTLDEWKTIEDKNKERRKNRWYLEKSDSYEYPDSIKKSLLPLIRRFPRCKTVHLEDVGRVYRSGSTYFFEVKNVTHKIHVKSNERW